MIRSISIIIISLLTLATNAQIACIEIEVDTMMESANSRMVKINASQLDTALVSIDESNFDIDIRMYRHSRIYNDIHEIYRITCNGNKWNFTKYEFYGMIESQNWTIDYYEPVLKSKIAVDSCWQCSDFTESLMDLRFFEQENMDLEKYMDSLDQVGHTVDYIFKYKTETFLNSFSAYSPQGLSKLFPNDYYLKQMNKIIWLFEEFDEIE